MVAGQLNWDCRAFGSACAESSRHAFQQQDSTLNSSHTLLTPTTHPQVPDALTSSMVDDAFYILKKCGSRALATGSVQCVAALLGELNDLLANSYRGALQVGACKVAGRKAR